MLNEIYFKVTNNESTDVDLHHERYKRAKEDLAIVDSGTHYPSKKLEGGVAFTDKDYLGHYLSDGYYVSKIELATCTQAALDVSAVRRQYRANEIWMGKKRDLREKETWDWLESLGVNVEKTLMNGLESIASDGKSLDYFTHLIKLRNCENKLKTNDKALIEMFKEACRGGNVLILQYLINNFNVIERFNKIHEITKQTELDIKETPPREYDEDDQEFEVVDTEEGTEEGTEEDTESDISPREYTKITKSELEDMVTKIAKEEFKNINKIVINKEEAKNLERDISSSVWYAALYNNIDAVKLLIKLFNNSISINLDMEWALRTAAEKGYLEIIKLLIESGADVYDYYSENALKNACANGHLDIVKYLVSKNDNIFDMAPDWHDGSTALSKAVSKGHLDIVKYLLEELGANLHQSGNEALKWIKDMSILEYLLKFVAKEQKIGGEWWNVWFDFLIRLTHNYGKEQEKEFARNTFTLFVENGMDINTYNGIFLKKAAQRGNLDLIKHLLSLKAELPNKEFIAHLMRVKKDDRQESTMFLYDVYLSTEEQIPE